MQNQQIKGITRLIGLLGHPVAHSLSPQIHNHALAQMGLPYAYVPLDVNTELLSGAIASLRAMGFIGANVTIPHKQIAASLCDELSEISRIIGAVNTLHFRQDLLFGTSTDAAGFFRALASMGHNPQGGSIIILGNGGTARTLAYALALEKNPASLAIVGRSQQKVRALTDEITAATGLHVQALTFDADRLESLKRSCTLCINCTSVGMYPHVDESPVPAHFFDAGMSVFDTIYNPAQTRFLSYAEKAGCPWQNGLRMLLYQGLESLKIWTGREVSEDLFDIQELGALIQSP